MRILITGGTGFLGRHIAERLMRDGYEVALLGRDFRAVEQLITQGAAAVHCDLRATDAVVAACRGRDAVVHAGALSTPWGPRAEYVATNIGGTAAVLRGCVKYGVGRLIHISSPAVIFDGRDQHASTEAAPFPRRFFGEYARTKAIAEQLVRAVPALPAVILRPKAIFGPGDRALLPRVIAAARAGRLPQIGDGSNLIDLIYVENAAHGVALALASERAPGHTYNLTNDEHIPIWELIRNVLGRLNIPNQLRPVPLPVMDAVAAALEARAVLTGQEPLLTRYTVAVLARTQTYDISAARRDLGYAPLVSVAEGFERTLEQLGHAQP